MDSVSEDKDNLNEERAFVNKLYQVCRYMLEPVSSLSVVFSRLFVRCCEKMEIDRLRYMVSSYLRTRLRKVRTLDSVWLCVED